MQCGRYSKRLTAWLLTFLMIMSLVVVPAGKVQAADVELTYTTGAQTISDIVEDANGIYTTNIDLGNTSGCTDISQLQSAGITKLQVTYKITACTQVSGADFGVQPFINAKNNWKGNWVNANADGNTHTVELDLTQLYSASGELWNFGVQFAGITSITYEITSAKLLKSSSSSEDSGDENTNLEEIGTTSSSVTATYDSTGSKPTDNYYEYAFTITNNSGTTINDWIIVATLEKDASSVNDNSSWSEVNAKGSGSTIYIYPITSKKSATISNGSSVSYSKIGYAGGAIASMTVYYSTTSGAFSDVLDNVSGGTASDSTTDLGLDIKYNYAKLLQYSLYMYDANMCGSDVDENCALTWRGDCHTGDYSSTYSKDLSGGYHDAGDHVKFGLPQAFAAATLGISYAEFKDAFTELGQEAHMKLIMDRFIDYFKKCTVMNDDGTVQAFCYQVGNGDVDHNYWGTPEAQGGRNEYLYFTSSTYPCTDIVALTAAAMAIYSYNYNDTESLTYAKALLAYAESMELTPSGGAPGTTGSQNYYYGDTCKDDLALASGWIYKASSAKNESDASTYQTKYNNYMTSASNGWTHCWNEVWAAAYLVGDKNSDLASLINGRKSATTPQGYAYVNDWGSARYNTALQMMALAYDKHTNTSTYAAWATGQMKYLLGNNETARCYVVGYNANSSKHPHHRAASGYNDVSSNATTAMKYTVLGALVGGPGASDDYSDVADNYKYNEISIDYNAGLVGAAAGLYLLNKDDADQYLITADSEEAVEGVKTYYGVSTVNPTGVTLDATTKELEVGDTFALTATVVPTNASQSVTWTSSDTSVATVDSSGMVTAKASGTATITATTVGKMESGESATATCEVTVLKSAELAFYAGSLECPSQVYGYTSVSSASANVTNKGEVVATPSSVLFESGENFTFIQKPTGAINPGAYASIEVTPKTGLAVGTYSDNVIITYDGKTLKIPVSVTINKKPITIKANDAEKTYGEVNPSLSVAPSYEENLESGDNLSYQLTTTATTNSNAGTYSIVLTVASHANYEITATNGTLTIHPKTVNTVNFPTASAVKLNQTLGDSILSGGSTEYGSFAWKNTDETLVKGTPSYDVVLTLNSNAVKNYSFAGMEGYDSNTGTITRKVSVNVTRADLPNITFPTASDIIYGQTLSDSFLNGGSAEYGTFTWENADYAPTESEIGTIQKNVVFTWSAESKTKYGLEDDEMTLEQMVTIKVNKQTNNNVPATPTLASRTANCIKVNETQGVVYSLDKMNWQAAGTFTGLSAFTSYQVYAKYAETTTQYESAVCETPLQVYTLVANPYIIDVSKASDANYIDALRMVNNGVVGDTTATYYDGVLTLKESNQTYTITGNSDNVTVKAPYGNTNIVLTNVTIKKLDVTNAIVPTIKVSGVSTVQEIISTSNETVSITGDGTLNAAQIKVSGSLIMNGPTVKVDTSQIGGAAISADNITISGGNVIAIGGNGAAAMTGNVIKIENSSVTATGGSGASAIETTGENGSITMKDVSVEVNVDADSGKSPITSDNITLVGNNTVSSSTGTDNIYSSIPKDENGNILATYTVKFLDLDARTEVITITSYAGGQITLPAIDKVTGYAMTWKNQTSGELYQPQSTFTVNDNITFVVNKQKIIVSKITLDITSVTLEVGDGEILTETVEPADALDKSVTWSSSNPAVATVTVDGEIDAVAPGTAVITAKAKDGSGVVATCMVTVIQGEPETVYAESIKITGATKKVAPGKKLKLKATVYPDNAVNKQVKWKVNNKKYATVNSKGVVTTKKAGKGKKVTVTAYLADDSSIIATYKISIMKNPVKKIKLSAKTTTLKKGKSVTIKARFTPSKGISKELTWTSSNKKVATVNSKGKVKAKKKGTTKITAKAKDGSGKKAIIKIRVE